MPVKRQVKRSKSRRPCSRGSHARKGHTRVNGTRVKRTCVKNSRRSARRRSVKRPSRRNSFALPKKFVELEQARALLAGERKLSRNALARRYCKGRLEELGVDNVPLRCARYLPCSDDLCARKKMLCNPYSERCMMDNKLNRARLERLRRGFAAPAVIPPNRVAAKNDLLDLLL